MPTMQMHIFDFYPFEVLFFMVLQQPPYHMVQKPLPNLFFSFYLSSDRIWESQCASRLFSPPPTASLDGMGRVEEADSLSL
jgi:hypothetical protein